LRRRCSRTVAACRPAGDPVPCRPVRSDRRRPDLEHALFTLVLLAASGVFALLEIQIEGPAGWAADLPTWRIQNRWTRLFLGARPITGYHLYFHALILLLLHLPYALGVAVSLAAELRIIAFYLLFWVLEDFLWFVLNPAYGLDTFRADRIWWHARGWWWFMPRDYWIFGPLGVLCYVLSL
jgi:hypothetical protein